MEELPLIDLFYELRKADLPLGIGEYRLFLRALQLGFGTESEEKLRQLCKTLWVKTPQDERQFEIIFRDMLKKRQQEKKDIEAATLAASLPGSVAQPTPAQQRPAPEQPAPVRQPSPEEPATAPAAVQPGDQPAQEDQAYQPAMTSEVVIDDEMAAARMVQRSMEEPGLPEQRFFLTGEYLPVTQRQMKQSWRYLRRMVKSGPAVTLNVEKTIQSIAKHGMLLDLVLEPERANRSELTLLVDQKGSMLPFQRLAQRLVETAQKGGRLGRTGAYYFQNVPVDDLYLTPHLVEARPINKVLRTFHPERTLIMIISDAGAARGYPSEGRVKQTEEFLKRLRSEVLRVVWLNPMPAERWPDSSAAEIARFVPMFEFSRRGLEAAIDVLRGRYAPLLGRL